LTKILCPICDKEQKQEPKKSWTYGKMIEGRTVDGTQWGASVRCSMYDCKCGKSFRYYLTVKGKSWTIPKKKTTAE
jgi:hypothetical protein